MGNIISPDPLNVIKDVEHARSMFRSRTKNKVLLRNNMFISLGSAILEINSTFEQLNFERFADDLMIEVIESVVDETTESPNVFMSEDQVIQVFQNLSRNAVEIVTIDEAREEWTRMFDGVVGAGKDAKLRINMTAWRLIQKIDNDRPENDQHMTKDEAKLLLHAYSEGGCNFRCL